MPAIKNIIFDLGNVLLDIDFKKVTRAFELLGIQHFEKQYSQLEANELFQQLETGKISSVDFYTIIQSQVSINLTKEDIQLAWNAILCDFRKESMEYLKTLTEKYRLFLLSNTNAIHLAEINAILLKQMGENNLSNYFEKAYYSQVVGMRKPHENIFYHVMNDAKINPIETLFVDDAFPNIATAKKLGFATHWLLPEERVEKVIPLQLI